MGDKKDEGPDDHHPSPVQWEERESAPNPSGLGACWLR